MHQNRRFSLDTDLAHRIEALARATRSTPGDVMRKAFEEYEANHNGSLDDATEESAFEALKRVGIIGCVKGGPTDLSSNPKYLEGLGA